MGLRPTHAGMKMDALLPRVAIGRYVEHRMRFSEQTREGEQAVIFQQPASVLSR